MHISNFRKEEKGELCRYLELRPTLLLKTVEGTGITCDLTVNEKRKFLG